MQKKLGKPLQIFARGRDGGIDITDDTVKKNVVIQAKHYIKSKYADLLSSLKKEVAKVAEFVKIIAHNGVREIGVLGICNDAYRDIFEEFVRKLPFFYYEKKINTFTNTSDVV